ncbi:MAG: hypothetical protein LBU04_04325 [Christensenellaceae bacterium]|jgi:hypothetical protein|nr:hypothetical protein [Christensenellaceae bacterium]
MRKSKLLIFVSFLALILAFSFFACAEAIQVDQIIVNTSSIELAISGQYSEFQIVASVLPENASNRNVIFFLADTDSQKFISISSTGLVRAIAGVTPEDKNCTVRVASVSNPKKYVDISVAVKTGEIERISFESSSIKITLDQDPYQLVPKIQPIYASLDVSLRYISTNPEIASVNEFGVVTPIMPGETNIEVLTGMSESTGASATIRVIVGYAPLDYNLHVRDNVQSIYKQIVGEPEPFWLDLYKLNSSKCDPNPEIIWQRNGSEIPGGNIRDEKSVFINPSSIGMTTAGVHKISAKLKSVDNEQTINLSDINIYMPLRTFNVIKQDSRTSFAVEEPILFTITHGANQYPPDNYVWHVIHLTEDDYIDINDPSNQAEIIAREQYLTTTMPQTSDGRIIGMLNFTATDNGEYYIIAYPTVNGVRDTSLRRMVYVGIVGNIKSGSDISGVYFDGYFNGQEYLPHVKWNPLPYDATYTVVVQNEDDLSKQLVFSTTSHPEYFPTPNSVIVPSSIATLSETFTIRIKSSKYGYTKKFTYEGNTIASSQYEMLNNEHAGYNRYISSLEELGELISYVDAFRPAHYKISTYKGQQHPEAYALTIYLPFTYDEIKDLYDPKGDAANLSPGSGTYSVAQINAFKIVAVVGDCYMTSGSFNYTILVDGNSNIVLQVAFSTPAERDLESTTGLGIEKRPIAGHYTDSPGQRALSIDALPQERTISVTTSEQLYFAVSHGFRPLPVENSAAALVYSLAREVLYRISDASMSDAEKIHAIYDYLTLNVVYDHQLAALSSVESVFNFDGFYLEGVFISHKAVCDGTAKAFSLLSWMDGVQSVWVGGDAIMANGRIVGHAWNNTFIDGKWYASDATWGTVREGVDMNYEYQTHAYLLVTDAMMLNSGHIVEGVYPSSAIEQNGAFVNLEYADGIDATISSIEEIETLAEYINNDRWNSIDWEATSGILWLEIYLDPVFIEESYDGDSSSAIQEFGNEMLDLVRAIHGVGVSINIYSSAENYLTIAVIT